MSVGVKKYYGSKAAKEWLRLVKDPYQRLEFFTTMTFIQKVLPPNGRILDAGGGPGRYAVEFARLGYDVTLLDCAPEMLKKARTQLKRLQLQNRVSLLEGSICDLSNFEDNRFDAVLCLGGPLSHVTDAKEREKAVDELIRVAKAEAPICVSVIGRLATIVTELIDFPEEIETETFAKFTSTGDYDGSLGFAPCHFFLPDELRDAFKDKHVSILGMVGLEGLASGHRKEFNSLFKNRSNAYRIWVDTHLQNCTCPTSVGISEHFMIICRKNFAYK
jgi:SAM-dependent methyltransferase